MFDLQVSVIIPVYNVARFVTQAVESALTQPETAEVILIEDGSPDCSLAVCQDLVEKHDKVRLLRHPGGVNRGVSASRNLGMKNAQSDYIAFLDADDYYLPGRFNKAKEIFAYHPDCEGVYEAIAMHVESAEGLERWRNAKRPERELQSFEQWVPPDKLAGLLIKGGSGSIHPNGLVFKKCVLKKIGFMEEKLPIHQDTNFNVRLALTSKLLPGSLDNPVAMWRVHSENRISQPRSKSESGKAKIRQWLVTYQWSRDHTSKEMQELILNRLLFYTVITPLRDCFSLKCISKSIILRIRLVNLFFRYPPIFFEPLFWKKMLPRQGINEQ